MSGEPVWSHAEVWDSVAAAIPEERAIVQGERALSWAEFSRQADALAAHLLARGLAQQSKVAVYTQNRAEYLIAYYAAFKAGLAPFNVNYRYAADEVLYLLENGDAEAVVFETEYAPLIERIREQAPLVKTWIAVADGGDIPPWAEDYAAIAACTPQTRPVRAPWGRSGDDLLILYTGGTTGMPKGVMWRQHDLYGRYGFVSNPLTGVPPLAHPHEAG
ncbi:MAG: AMP-binding protein, partial [Hydrogenophilaceae bacterium]|nr:AMP-binding protein [Hydrogenophilaceae bacterium]